MIVYALFILGCLFVLSVCINVIQYTEARQAERDRYKHYHTYYHVQ